jgi:transposase
VLKAGRIVQSGTYEELMEREGPFRDLATRYAKRAAYYRAEIIIASIVLWLRTDLQDTP